MRSSCEEAIFFYTRNSYLIVNNYLCGNWDLLWEVAAIVNDDAKCVLQEHADGARRLDKKSIARYQNRIYETLDEKTKEKILETARRDIANILSAMQPARKEIKLYRTVWHVRVGDLLDQYHVGDSVEFQIISSTSVTPYREDAGPDFFRYEISVPKNGRLLKLDRFGPVIRNEDGEVLLPPMKCRVRNIRGGDTETCRGIIALEYQERLPVTI